MKHGIPLSAVCLTQGFWKEKQQMVCNQTVPHMWAALNDRVPGAPRSGAIHNFRMAAGLEEGDFIGLVSQDSDLYKWMEAAAYAQNNAADPATAEALDAMISLLEKAQRKDGYLNSFYQLYHPDEPWAYLKESCQLYCAGHMIEAGVGCWEATGDKRLLKVACQLANRIDADFGTEPGKLPGYDGHAEIELALMRLYHATGEERYLKRAQYFIEQRGTSPFYFDVEKEKEVRGNLVYALKEEDYHHSQSHAPIREQKVAKGHAVKAMYFYSGAADVAMATGDETLVEALDTLWDSVMRQLYVTGAIGSSEHGERFTVDYDLPNDLDYGETCASIGLIMFAWRMAQIHPRGCYGDAMERALWNNVLAGIAADGKAFFYTNPLEYEPRINSVRFDRSHLLKQRQAWFECPCCPPNIARLIGSVQRFLYTETEDTVYTHLYISSKAAFGCGLEWELQTCYPDSGEISIVIQNAPEAERGVALRLPSWCRQYELTINGETVSASMEEGFLVVRRVWQAGDQIRLSLNIVPEIIYPDARIRAAEGKVCVCRGPVVYCAESHDNDNSLDGLVLQPHQTIREEKASIAGEPCIRLVAEGRRELPAQVLYSAKPAATQPAEIVLHPYALWNNRGETGMRVFFPKG